MFSYVGSPGSKGWKKINDLRAVKPGDLILHQYEQKKQKSTGHLVIVAGMFQSLGKIELEGQDYWEYRVPVIDSARGFHELDTRNSGGYAAWPAIGYTGTTRTGVGKGFVYYGVNKAGKICYERWNDDRKPVFSGQFKIARAVPLL
jgi:hypothetical protein